MAEEKDPKKLCEAALFMSPSPISLDELTKIMGLTSFSLSLKVIEDLMNEYNSRDSSLAIVKTGDKKFAMTVRPAYLKEVSHLAVGVEMSKAVLRTLGLIAVKQPVKQSIIVRIVGNKAYDYIKELIEKGFLIAQKKGQTKVLSTSPKFDSYFGKQAEEIKAMSTKAYQTVL